jgi:competence protein ComEC
MKKYVLLTLATVLALAGFLTYQYFIFNDGKLHIVFCNVGQGDGILIRTPGQKYITVDSGPDKSILDCLGRHMPLWQRDIDLALLTHPHQDHFMGYYFLSDRYHIKAFATERLDNKTPAFQMLKDRLKEKKIAISYLFRGDKFELKDGVGMAIEGPSLEHLDRSSPGGLIGETKELASLITLISFGSFTTLLTGDSQTPALEEAVDLLGRKVIVLQAPHHGSASGLNASIVEKLAPKMAAISVGKNKYGHPTRSTLQLLSLPGILLKRTDKDGDVEIVSDGKSWRSL